MTLQAGQSDELRDIAIPAYSILVLLAALLLGWREGLLTGILSIAVIWFFAFQEHFGTRVYSINPPLGYARDLTAVFIISSVLTYILIYRLNRSLSDSRLELRERLRAEETLHLQARYLTALHETTFGLLNRLELSPLLESILDRTSELLETPHVALNLVLSDGSALKQIIGRAALEVARARLGEPAAQAGWLCSDVTTYAFEPAAYDLWHDRAVFHFLTDPVARPAYVGQVLQAVKPGGHVIVATFGPEGPEKCSGLDVVRYDADSLHDQFGARFTLVDHQMEEHTTPAGRQQQFVYCMCRTSAAQASRQSGAVKLVIQPLPTTFCSLVCSRPHIESTVEVDGGIDDEAPRTGVGIQPLLAAHPCDRVDSTQRFLQADASHA